MKQVGRPLLSFEAKGPDFWLSLSYKAVAAGSHCFAQGQDASSQQCLLSLACSYVKLLSLSLGKKNKSLVTLFPTTSATPHC